MSRSLRFVLALIVGLAVLTATASYVVNETTRAWVEKDLDLRARLAVNGVQRPLLAAWQAGSPDELNGLLAELTHDERILAAAACDPQSQPLAPTADFPHELSSASVGGPDGHGQRLFARRAGSGWATPTSSRGSPTTTARRSGPGRRPPPGAPAPSRR